MSILTLSKGSLRWSALTYYPLKVLFYQLEENIRRETCSINIQSDLSSICRSGDNIWCRNPGIFSVLKKIISLRIFSHEDLKNSSFYRAKVAISSAFNILIFLVLKIKSICFRDFFGGIRHGRTVKNVEKV